MVSDTRAKENKYAGCKGDRKYLGDKKRGEALRTEAAPVKPLDVLDETVDKSPLVAADTIGAGVGETVIIVGGSSARNAAGDVSIPVDATVVGIVDDLEIDRSVL